MADSPNTPLEVFSQPVDPAPDLPDLARLSLEELDILSELHSAIPVTAEAFCSQPRCTPAIERIIGETENRSWHFVNAIAEEAASRKPEAKNKDEMIRARIMLRTCFDLETLDLVILRLADEIRAGRPAAQ